MLQSFHVFCRIVAKGEYHYHERRSLRTHVWRLVMLAQRWLSLPVSATFILEWTGTCSLSVSHVEGRNRLFVCLCGSPKAEQYSWKNIGSHEVTESEAADMHLHSAFFLKFASRQVIVYNFVHSIPIFAKRISLIVLWLHTRNDLSVISLSQWCGSLTTACIAIDQMSSWGSWIRRMDQCILNLVYCLYAPSVVFVTC